MQKKAIILVAGMGTRLKPLTLKNHKCLTKIGDTPILYNALRNLKKEGVEEVVLVVGYLADAIKENVGTEFEGIKIIYKENEIFERTNTSYSLKLGLEIAGDYDSIILLEGDVFFESKLLHRLFQDSHKNATILEKYREELDGTFVEMNNEGYVVDWTHKSMREAGYILDDKYKTVNIHKFEKDFIDNVLYPVLQLSCKQSEGKEPLENIMREIVRGNDKAIFGICTEGDKWFEIDDMKDLSIAEEIFKEGKA